MKLNTLLLLQHLLHSQHISVGADDAEIRGILEAKADLATAIALVQSDATVSTQPR